MSPSGSDDKLVLVGRFGAAHGIRGEVRIKSFTDDPLTLAKFKTLTTASGDPLTLTKARLTKNMLIASVKGISDRNAAEALNGKDIFAPRTALDSDTEEDEFLYADLIGLEARAEDGTRLGVVTAIDNYGAGDILSVKLDGGKTELLPFTLAVVPTVKVPEGYLVISPPAEIMGDAPEDGETA